MDTAHKNVFSENGKQNKNYEKSLRNFFEQNSKQRTYPDEACDVAYHAHLQIGR